MSFENKSSESLPPLAAEVQKTIKEIKIQCDEIFDYFAQLAAPGQLENKRLALLSPVYSDKKILEGEIADLIRDMDSPNFSADDEFMDKVLKSLHTKLDRLSDLKTVTEQLVEVLLTSEVEEAFATGGEVAIDFNNPDGIKVDITKNELVLAEEEPIVTDKVEPESTTKKVKPSIQPTGVTKPTLSAYEMADTTALHIEGRPEAGLKSWAQIETELSELFKANGLSVAGAEFLKSKLVTAQATAALFIIGGKAEAVEDVYLDFLHDVSAFLKTSEADKDSGQSNLESPIEDGADDVEADISRSLEAFALFKSHLEANSHIRAANEFTLVERAVIALNDYQQVDPVRAASDRRRMLGVLQKRLASLSDIIKDTVPAVTPESNRPTSEVPAEVASVGEETKPSPEDVVSDVVVKDVTAPDLNAPDPVSEASKTVTSSSKAASVPEVTVDSDTKLEVSAADKESNDLKQRQLLGRERIVQKQEFREKEKDYLARMEEYYKGEGLKSALRSGLKNSFEFVGLKPKLPQALEALRSEYNSARQLYASALEQALDKRSLRLDAAGIESNDYFTGTEKFNQVFASNFIFKPQERLLLAQERNLLSPEQRQHLARFTSFMSKHKQLSRIGMVTAAGVVAGLSGGVGMALAGASWQAWKIAANSTVGAGAARLTQKSFAGRVEAKGQNLAETKSDTLANFDVRKLETLEQNLRQAEVEARVVKTQQKVATVGAAIAAGGLTGYGLGSLDTLTDRLDSVNQALENTGAGVVEDITVKIDGAAGAGMSEVVLTNISLGEKVNLEALTDTEWSLLDDYLKHKAADLLSAHPNLSEIKLEAELFKSLENKFGHTKWWHGSGIEKVDIGEIKVVDTKLDLSVTNTIPVETSDITVSETVLKSTEYIVKPDDTLSGIILKEYPEKFADMSPVERNQALYHLVTKLESNKVLVEQLGLRSGDIDLIYPGEKIDLKVIDSVFDNESSIIPGTKTGALNVEVDSEVKTVPIKIIEKEIVGATQIEFEGKHYTEAPTMDKAEVVEPIKSLGNVKVNPTSVIVDKLPSMSKVFALNGQYLEQPAYAKYAAEVFGTGKSFEMAVERSVNAFDNETYDFVDSLGGGYESPYRLIGEMSLRDLAEFSSQPGDEVRYFLSQNNIKYETYLAWVDKVKELQEKFPHQDSTKVADLFGREVIDDKVLNMAKALKK